jgi:L-threonylcarbamoyladenylate synthase
VERIVVDPARPDGSLLARAAAVIRAGGIVAFPTDTLYGLAADPFNAAAVRRVFEAKERPSGLALPLVAADRAQVVSQIGPLTPLALRLAEQFWPGPLTILMRAPRAMAAGVSSDAGKVGVRVPAHAVARELCRSAGSVLVATSANPSGRPATTNPTDVQASMGGSIDMLIDSGPTALVQPSTIVDATGDEVQLIRAGAIPWEEIEACLQA